MFAKRLACLALLAVGILYAARKPGQPLKPGFNLFSKQQDIQLGQTNAKQVSGEYQVVQDEFLQSYVRRIGERLAAAPEARQSGFPFTFTVLNAEEVNAFALPGGPMFIFSGLMKMVDTEAQLAGVMGHEMAHVILRHGTNQATKANLLQIPAMFASGIIGNDSAIGQLANMGLGLGANSYLLKFSRDAETQADALGSYLIANAGYDPVQMASFFQKLGGQSRSQGLEFFASHPNPGNRDKAIRAEVQTMRQRSYGFQTGEFQRMKSQLTSLPAPPKKAAAASAGSGGQPQVPAAPTGAMQEYRGKGFNLSYPASWQVFGEQDSSVTLAPKEGLVQQNGNVQVGYGAVLSYFVPDSRADLKSATDDLIRKLRSDNPGMQVVTAARSTRAGNTDGMIAMLGSTSAFGGAETDALVTVLRPQGLFYMVFVSPEKNFAELRPTFDKMVSSLRFP